MATVTFDKRIILDQKDAEHLAAELEKKPVGRPNLPEDFQKENEREVKEWLSSFEK